jgi:hypothetical protein
MYRSSELIYEALIQTHGVMMLSVYMLNDMLMVVLLSVMHFLYML